VEQIYAFADKSGRELALRPEMTPSLARMVAARQGSLTFPLKWFAIAQCFRYERMTRGRKREHYQWNLDVVGETSIGAEAEVIAAAVHALSLLGLGAGDFFVHVNSRALLADLLLKLGLPREHHAAAFLALDKKGRIPDEEVAALLSAAGLDAAARGAAAELLRIASLSEATDIVGRDCASGAALQQLLDLLDAYGIRDRVRFDIAVVRGLAYYTGVVFEAFDAKREFRAIFGGGRYDNLLAEVGGHPATGVGLGFGDVVIAEILAAKAANLAIPAATDVAIGYMQPEQRAAAMSVARALRAAGRSVDLALSPEKARHFFARVGKGGFREATYLGPDDVQAGKVRVKDLASHAEREAPLSEFLTEPASRQQPAAACPPPGPHAPAED